MNVCKTLFLALILPAVSAASPLGYNPPRVRHDVSSADSLPEVTRLMRRVEKKAEDLVKSGFTAGDGYGEVWIRDFNTFMEVACRVNDRALIREHLLTFFKFQQEDGQIIDGYIPASKANVGYDYFHTPLAPGYAGHKNTVETDQESSLVQAVARYIRTTGDRTILQEEVGGVPVEERLEMALRFLFTGRFSQEYGLIWGATTADWGDVQPEHSWGVELDSSSHRAIDVYDNAMALIAIRDFLDIVRPDKDVGTRWNQRRNRLAKNVRKHLWDAGRGKFRPHIYLEGSPFPASFDEDAIYYHGGTAVAIEAGLLSREEVREAYEKMQQNVRESGAASIGLTLYPVYPEGFFKNPGMGPYSYQNGGDWTWFGARMATQLARYGFREEALEALRPMLERVVKNDGFFEWYTRENRPEGSGSFRGSAGVLWSALQALKDTSGQWVVRNNGLNNFFYKLKNERKATVAFLGGSITHMKGWRDLLCEQLRKEYPQVDFTFINAGIPSLGSLPHAFRLERDVLEQGQVDLLFLESAVNDETNGTPVAVQQRALEGIVRHIRQSNPFADIVLMAFADPGKMERYRKGEVPAEVAVHERVARHYGLPFINLAREITERIDAGEFTWEGDFKDLHPSPFGQQKYFETIFTLFAPETAEGVQLRTSTLPAPLDPANYSRGHHLDIHSASRLRGFRLIENWTPAGRGGEPVTGTAEKSAAGTAEKSAAGEIEKSVSGEAGTPVAGTRKGFVNVPVLEGTRPGAGFRLDFKGTVIGIGVVSGPDAGTLEYRIDGKPQPPVDLYTRWSSQLHLPWFLLLADELPPGEHRLEVTISPRHHPSSTGTAVRIVCFLEN